MSLKEDFVEIKDAQSVERMLGNAEIDYETVVEQGTIVSIIAENGVEFQFDEQGNLEGMQFV